MNNFILIFAFYTYLSNTASCQGKRDPILFVLSRHVIGKTFSFNFSKSANEKNTIKVKYLGKVKTKAHVEYSVLTWARIWGSNEHTTGVVFLYTANNKYAGKYVLGSMFDLPSEIEGNNLIFTNEIKEDCDKSIVTKVSFDSIPQNIFIRCKGDYGDIYSYRNGQ